MSDLDLRADTVFRDQAVLALDSFFKDHECPVKRAQVEGLRQVAFNQPDRLREFVDHQKTKAAKRKFEHEVAFWDLVLRLCLLTANAQQTWSLPRFAAAEAPAEYQLGPRPPGNAGAEEHKAYRETKVKADAWHRRRIAEDYPAFFQRFCAHYLYLSSQVPETQEDDQ